MARSDISQVFREILVSLPEVIVLVDDEARVAEVNRPDAALFGTPPRPGDKLSDVIEVEPLHLVEHLVATARSNGVADGEMEYGSELYRVVARRLRSTEKVLLYFQDVTVRRRAEDTLMEMVRDKSSFLETVSHQLRAPLTAVVAYADMLSRTDTELDDATRTAMVEHMTDRAWDLAGIVEDLLAIARTDIGDLRVVSIPFDLTANATQVIESMGYRGADIDVVGDTGVTGLGDPTRFRQIVRNLLSNALDHGAEPVTVSITSNGDHAVLAVSDAGTGVAPEMESKLFTRFVTRGDPGTPDRIGIGLLVSSELATLMGGEIAYSREDGRTVFMLEMPLRQG